MSKRIIFVVVVLGFFFGFKFASASLKINEVMYNPNNGDTDWVEVYSTEDTPVKTGNTGDDTWHFVSGSSNYHFTGSDFTIEAGKYFIFACNKDKFILNHSEFSSDDVVDVTATGINNDGATLKILDENGTLVDSIFFTSSQGGNSDGNSLQLRPDGSWKACEPTPGSATSPTCGDINSPSDSGNDDETPMPPSSSHSYNSSETKPKTISIFNANILAPTLAFAGQPIEFNLDVKYGDDTYKTGEYFWNFGDGVSKEEAGGFQKFTHTYYYPGEYNVSLEYKKNNGSLTTDATDEIIIKVVPLTVSISNVGDAKDFFVELTNNADSKIDISKWVLSSNNKIFTFPKNSTIAGNKFLIVPGRISGFTIEDEKDLKLIMPTGEVVFDYDTKSAPVKKLSVQSNSDAEDQVSNTYQKEIETEISDENNLTAAPVLSGAGNQKSIYLFVGLIILLGVCGGAVYFIRRNRKVVTRVGDDFDILDE